MDTQEDPPTEKLWFKAKTYGYGWTPCSWQGWLVVLIYFVLVFLSSWEILSGNSGGGEATQHFLVRTFVLTFFLLYISWKKGERPRWRWGREDKTHDDASR